MLLFYIVYYSLVASLISIRPEHIAISSFYLVLFFLSKPTRQLTITMLPFLLFGATYDFLRICPNWTVNPVDIEGVYEAEKSLFGITVDGQLMTLNEYFCQHHNSVFDFLGGIFYLCWVPVPMAFAFYLFFTGRRGVMLRYTWAFLLINVCGFIVYYVHPTAPPWYYAEFGNVLHTDTPGNVAGLVRFDEMVGIDVYQGMYTRNSNVFAAIPSLHATKCLGALVYAYFGRTRWYIKAPIALIAVGICFTAVYTNHHYIIDILIAIALVAVVVTFWELLLRYCTPLRHFFDKMVRYVSEK